MAWFWQILWKKLDIAPYRAKKLYTEIILQLRMELKTHLMEGARPRKHDADRRVGIGKKYKSLH